MDIEKEFEKMKNPENANIPEPVDSTEMDEIQELASIEGLVDEYLEDIIESEHETVDIELVPEEDLIENGLYDEIEDDHFYQHFISSDDGVADYD